MGSTGAVPRHLKGYLEYIGVNVQQNCVVPYKFLNPNPHAQHGPMQVSFYPFRDPPTKIQGPGRWNASQLRISADIPGFIFGGAGRRACFICGDQFAEEDDAMEVLTLAKQTSLTQRWMD